MKKSLLIAFQLLFLCCCCCCCVFRETFVSAHWINWFVTIFFLFQFLIRKKRNVNSMNNLNVIQFELYIRAVHLVFFFEETKKEAEKNTNSFLRHCSIISRETSWGLLCVCEFFFFLSSFFVFAICVSLQHLVKFGRI